MWYHQLEAKTEPLTVYYPLQKITTEANLKQYGIRLAEASPGTFKGEKQEIRVWVDLDEAIHRNPKHTLVQCSIPMSIIKAIHIPIEHRFVESRDEFHRYVPNVISLTEDIKPSMIVKLISSMSDEINSTKRYANQPDILSKETRLLVEATEEIRRHARIVYSQLNAYAEDFYAQDSDNFDSSWSQFYASIPGMDNFVAARFGGIVKPNVTNFNPILIQAKDRLIDLADQLVNLRVGFNNDHIDPSIHAVRKALAEICTIKDANDKGSPHSVAIALSELEPIPEFMTNHLMVVTGCYEKEKLQEFIKEVIKAE